MANISNKKTNKVSYSYDTEAKNSIGLRTKILAWKNKLVYDKDTKAPTEVIENNN